MNLMNKKLNESKKEVLKEVVKLNSAYFKKN